MTSDTTKIDSLSIVPGSMNMKFPEKTPEKNSYTIDTLRSLFIVKNQEKFFRQSDSVKIKFRYRVFPYNFDITWESPYEKNSEKDIRLQRALTREKSDDPENFLDFGNLRKSGSISRGFSLGNKQGATLNSNLNLQLNGVLTNDINVKAAITDNNIPVQPEGNTQQLQDFDKVFIELNKNKHRLIAGDFNVRQQKDRFMRYNRKVQGLKAETAFNPGENEKEVSISAGAALSKGKYARNEIEGLEGNQGPYKLEGNNNERFIVVLSGSEKIYLDGKLLERGKNRDYVINYNTAEITFTPEITITKDSRIIAEFEYADRNYARALFTAKSSYKTQKLQLNLNYFNQTDLKNQSFEQEINDTTKSILASAGDDPKSAIMSGIDSVPYSNDEILYKMVDSLGYDSVLVYSTNPDSAKYRVKFSKVRMNEGNYVKKQSAANGKVYRWVKPQGGVPQGEYAPVEILVAPKQQQMLSLSGHYDFSSKTRLGFSASSSVDDQNLFSDLDAKDDNGFAYEARLQHQENLHKNRDSSELKWTSQGSFSMINKNFSPIDRFRPVEFERDWNLKGVSGKREIQSNEIQTEVKTGIREKKTGHFSIKYQYLNRWELFEGNRYSLNGNFNKNGYFAKVNASMLQTSQQQYNTRFIRHRTKAGKKFNFFRLTLDEDYENNVFRLSGDSLGSKSQGYQTFGGELSLPDTSRFSSTLRVQQRKDYLPLDGSFTESSRANEASLDMDWEIKKHQNLKFRLAYRQLEIKDSIATAAPQENVNTRLDYQATFADGMIKNQTFYQNGSGLEVKKDFTYLEVSPGKGVYQWEDYNDNNVKEKNEFEEANFQDQARYIRVYTPTDDYIKVYNNKFTEVLKLNPSRKWKDSDQGFKKLLSKFSDRFTWRIKQKNQLDNYLKAYNPFYKTENKSKLITLNEQLKNNFYFQRNHSKFGANWTYLKSHNKRLLANGSEQTSREKHALNIRWNISSEFSLLSELSRGNKSRNSEFFSSKDYSINFTEIKPSLSYQPSNKFRIRGLFTYSHKQNQTPEKKEAHIRKYGIELRRSTVNKGNLSLKFNYLNIKYPGSENNNLEFEMLKGFKDGNNMKWSLDYERNILKYLQLNLRYEGRKTPGAKAVHIGRIQIRAYF